MSSGFIEESEMGFTTMINVCINATFNLSGSITAYQTPELADKQISLSHIHSRKERSLNIYYALGLSFSQGFPLYKCTVVQEVKPEPFLDFLVYGATLYDSSLREGTILHDRDGLTDVASWVKEDNTMTIFQNHPDTQQDMTDKTCRSLGCFKAGVLLDIIFIYVLT